MKHSSSYIKVLAIAAPVLLSACGGDDDDASPTPIPDAEYHVTVINTTHNQPLSPIATLLHSDDYSAWSIGSAATDGLAVLAESGSPTDFLAEHDDQLDLTSAEGVTGPGATTMLTVTGPWNEALSLTVVSMLVNTNDAFVGTTGWDIGHLEIGDSAQLLAPIYDAGTEANTETAATIPGPAAGGEGVSEGREDSDQVTRHPGVVTQDDGYAESALDQSHRFDNGAMHILVERVL